MLSKESVLQIMKRHHEGVVKELKKTTLLNEMVRSGVFRKLLPDVSSGVLESHELDATRTEAFLKDWLQRSFDSLQRQQPLVVQKAAAFGFLNRFFPAVTFSPPSPLPDTHDIAHRAYQALLKARQTLSEQQPAVMEALRHYGLEDRFFPQEPAEIAQAGEAARAERAANSAHRRLLIDGQDITRLIRDLVYGTPGGISTDEIREKLVERFGERPEFEPHRVSDKVYRMSVRQGRSIQRSGNVWVPFDPDEASDNKIREQVLAVLEKHPGLRLFEIQEKLQHINPNTVKSNLRLSLQCGFVDCNDGLRSLTEGGRRYLQRSRLGAPPSKVKSPKVAGKTLYQHVVEVLRTHPAGTTYSELRKVVEGLVGPDFHDRSLRHVVGEMSRRHHTVEAVLLGSRLTLKLTEKGAVHGYE